MKHFFLSFSLLVFYAAQGQENPPAVKTLAEVVVSAQTLHPYRTISDLDIGYRAVSSSQDVLRIVPGLFIGQHQGGGKAEQIFLRGFDNDHGTDIHLSVDGMPINMVSHAHGQGYADSHFIIPETIESTRYEKGMYNAGKGDLAVSGFAEFMTRKTLDKDVFRVEGGQFDTYRVLGMFNLLSGSQRDRHSWYVASEYRFSNGYFDNPQHFKRFNAFTRYSGRVGAKSILTVSVSTMHSGWLASGQIPDIAVSEGFVGFYGALDPAEGGETSRTNVNLRLLTAISDKAQLTNQFYYSNYQFDLHSNFTFFLVDSVHGDEIRQKEGRHLLGYNGGFSHDDLIGQVKLTSTIGWNVRLDWTHNTSLSHTIDRYVVIDPIALGNISERQADIYWNGRVQLSSRWAFDIGGRYDYLHYSYNNKLASDSTLHGVGIYEAHNAIVSPKLKLSYVADDRTMVYLFAGKGFHSNDTRVVVAENGKGILPAAYGTDLGLVFKPMKGLLLNVAIWYSYLQREYVYGGDGGTVDFSGRTRRLGLDVSIRYQPFPCVYVDADLNYAHGRSVDAGKGEGYIPLAPVWSSAGGITWRGKGGFSGSIRYRTLGNRPANDKNTLVATGYFVADLVLSYRVKQFEFGLAVQNLLNTKWKETQFDTYFRLKGHAAVDGMTFTAGTRFASLAHLSYFFD